MSDLISKQTLLYALDDTALTDDGGVDINELIDLIKRMPTIEVEPVKNELLKSKDSPDNVFVMKANIFAPDGIIKGLREELAAQIRSGVVILPSYIELVAITGPCTDVEVRIITEEEKHDG